MQKTINIILFILFIFPLICWSQEWQIISRMPIPVYGGQAVVHDSLIYILGGYSDSLDQALNIIQVYNPQNNSWSISEFKMKIDRYGHAASIFSDSLVLYYGGCDTSEQAESIEMWDFISEPYIHNYNYNFSRKFSTAVVGGDNLYILGGYPESKLDISWSLPYLIEYNIPSDTLNNEFFSDEFTPNTKYNNPEEFPIQQMSALINNNIYIFGGVYYGISIDINRFNVIDHSWETVSKMIEERAGGAAVMTDDSTIVIIGGYNEYSITLASIEVYLVYKSLSVEGPYFVNLNNARSELMAACYDNTIYVFGGKDESGVSVPFVEKISKHIFYEAHKGYWDIPTNTENIEISPAVFKLYDNYPNPFNNETTITFENSASINVKLEVYSILGKVVRTLINKKLEPGTYSILWNGTNNQNSEVSSGIYIYILTIENHSEAKRMLLLR